MLTFKVRWVDVQDFVAHRVQPAVFVPREAAHSQPKAWTGATQVGTSGTDWVLMGGALNNDKMDFSPVRTEDVLRVPLVGYVTARRTLSDLIGLGVQIGMSAVVGVRCLTDETPDMVHLILSHECVDLAPAADGFQFYVGIAIHTER